MKRDEIKAGALLSYLNLLIGNLMPFIYTPIMLRMLGQAESTAESSVTAVVKLIDEMNQHYDQLRSVYEKISKNRQVYREKNNLQ